jgi:hypothetical protein
MRKKIYKMSNFLDFVYEFLLFLRQLSSEHMLVYVKTVFMDESLVHLRALS